MNESITFDVYQGMCARTFPVEMPRELAVIGLCGEVGEVAELIKKHLYHGKSLDKDMLAKEIGDVLWYLNYCASVFGLSMNDIAQKNVEKLMARYPNGFEPQRVATGDVEVK